MSGGKFEDGFVTGVFSRGFNDNLHQKFSKAWNGFKSYLGGHTRVGWAASFRIRGVLGGTIDAGSAQINDATGIRTQTTGGVVHNYTNGRTQAAVSFLGLFDVSATNTTSNNGQSWNYGDIQVSPGIIPQTLSGQSSITIDLSIGVGVIYEDTFTFDNPFN